MEEKLTHIDENGRPRMVNVGEKADTKRIAVAKGSIYMAPETLKRIEEGSIAKGDVLSVAQTAGIMAAKNTASNIPMCHNIFITGVDMDFQLDEESRRYISRLRRPPSARRASRWNLSTPLPSQR